ncbi:MMPL family transporter [Streptomyces sp. NPDC050504]|uniref:MMPL family transporter n=1 Tax=Streptomyces sp. NPDC050504 TaxID=3365618 RepID=UPI00379CC892
MFGRVGRFSVNRPWLTIVAWILAAVALSAFAPKLQSSTDQSDFLPSHYESVRVSKIEESAFPKKETTAAIVVYQRADGGKLTAADKADVLKVTQGLQAKKYKTFAKVETNPQSVSQDGLLALANVYSTEKDPMAQSEEAFDDVDALREAGKGLIKGTDLEMGVTGNVAQSADATKSAGDTDAMIMSATLLLIIVLLGAIFRSPLIALLPVVMIGVMFAVANGFIATVSDAFGMEADSSVTPILIVVLFGVGTDYILFLLFRYREHLRQGMEPKEALILAVSRVGETIASAAGAVIVAFLALVLSTMGSMRAMGPSLAISVAVTLVAALTLVPAVFSLLGTKAFWPSKAWKTTPKNAMANSVGRMTARRPALVAAVSGGVLAILAVGALGFKAEFDQSSSLPKDLESVRVMDDVQKSFSAGQADPALVYVKSQNGAALDKAQLAAFEKKVAGFEGVGSVSPATPNDKGDVVMYSVVLKHKPASEKAIELVGGDLRSEIHDAAPQGSKAYVGGMTAVLADIETAVTHDYKLVFPVAGLAIMIILGLLLRSIVAPLYLMVAVGLGFTATLGSSVWLFQDIKGESGMLFMLPVIVYLFVVAIGTDYNILMVARLREEIRQGHGPREAVRLAVSHSAPTISAAAIILAGTFGVLMLADNSMLQQMGFAVAFGILLTAFVMALLLVPTVTSLLGPKVWWPGHRPEPDAGTVPRAHEAQERIPSNT